MHRGYIKLWRKIQDNKFWNERRKFSKAEAWIDLLMEARHDIDPLEVGFGMTSVVCHRGQCVKSTRTWADRWGWSEHKVRNFLRVLRDSRAIATETGAKWTQITILNYSDYQEGGRKLDARRTHDGRTTGDKQKCKNERMKEVKTKTKESDFVLPEWVDLETWSSFIEHRKILKSPMSIQAQRLAVTTLEKLKAQGNNPVDVINQSIERGWKGFFPVNGDRNQSKTSPLDGKLSKKGQEQLEIINRWLAKGDNEDG